MVTITLEERAQIEAIIRKNKICYVGLIDKNGLPYVIPMNFGYENDVIYLHSGAENSSIATLKKNPNVCITFCSEPELVYQNEEVACSYRMKSSSVICRGKVTFEESFEGKIKALDIIAKQYSERKFTYSDPAVNNVVIWKVDIEQMSTRIFGVPYKKSLKPDNHDFSGY